MNSAKGPAGTAYLPAADVLRMLDIRAQSLYAYVSRGWIRSIAQPGRKDHLYFADDVEKMRSRSSARAGHGVVAAAAMQWGEPIVPTTITRITEEGPDYRGYSAVRLAEAGTSFEAVAELLWTGRLDDASLRWPAVAPRAAGCALAGPLAAPASGQLLEIFSLFTLQLGMAPARTSTRAGPSAAGRELIQTLTGCFGYLSRQGQYCPMRAGESVASSLLQALVVEDSADNRAAMDAILVLLADHELSPGAFAARVAASAGATLHNCVASAICTISGAHIGKLYDGVAGFLGHATSSAVLMKRARGYHERGNLVPGFGHPLYRNGDPRARCLLETARRLPLQSRQLQAIYQFIDRAESALGIFPRQELGVVALLLAMGAPAASASALFALARVAGFVAHVDEQRQSGTLLRPRAKFIGQAAPGAA
jgi:citrate synthase